MPREKFIFTNNSAKYKDMYISFLAIKKASQLLNIRKFKRKPVTTFRKYFLKLKKIHVRNNIEIFLNISLKLKCFTYNKKNERLQIARNAKKYQEDTAVLKA